MYKRICNDQHRLNEYKRLSTFGKAVGIENRMLSPNETQEIFPLLDPKAFIGGLYSPGDGVVDPAMLCNALTRAAKKNGAMVIEECPVLDVITGNSILGSKNIQGVNTPYGTIKTSVKKLNSNQLIY